MYRYIQWSYFNLVWFSVRKQLLLDALEQFFDTLEHFVHVHDVGGENDTEGEWEAKGEIQEKKKMRKRREKADEKEKRKRKEREREKRKGRGQEVDKNLMSMKKF